jgi:hypothetical protein
MIRRIWAHLTQGLLIYELIAILILINLAILLRVCITR